MCLRWRATARYTSLLTAGKGQAAHLLPPCLGRERLLLPLRLPTAPSTSPTRKRTVSSRWSFRMRPLFQCTTPLRPAEAMTTVLPVPDSQAQPPPSQLKLPATMYSEIVAAVLVGLQKRPSGLRNPAQRSRRWLLHRQQGPLLPGRVLPLHRPLWLVRGKSSDRIDLTIS